MAFTSLRIFHTRYKALLCPPLPNIKGTGTCTRTEEPQSPTRTIPGAAETTPPMGKEGGEKTGYGRHAALEKGTFLPWWGGLRLSKALFAWNHRLTYIFWPIQWGVSYFKDSWVCFSWVEKRKGPPLSPSPPKQRQVPLSLPASKRFLLSWLWHQSSNSKLSCYKKRMETIHRQLISRSWNTECTPFPPRSYD